MITKREVHCYHSRNGEIRWSLFLDQNKYIACCSGHKYCLGSSMSWRHLPVQSPIRTVSHSEYVVRPFCFLPFPLFPNPVLAPCCRPQTSCDDIGITCQFFAHFNGINVILYFLPENLTWVEFTVLRSLLYAGACALVYCASTILTMFS